MLSVKGKFQNGIVRPDEPIAGREGQSVIVTFLEDDNSPPIDDSAWDDFDQLIKDCQLHSGIGDLAHQHDHYLYGTPKRKD